jgi:hypothetical protein
VMGFFMIRLHAILLISASWVARITEVSHRCPAVKRFFYQPHLVFSL